MGGASPSRIALERRGDLLEIRLDRPEVRNAFDDVLIAELQVALDDAAGDPTLRCLLLAGAGPTFCAGADLAWMRRAADFGAEENARDARRMACLFATLDAFPAPTVARVQGVALGGGVGLVSCVDVAIADQDARFGFTEVRLGIIPAVISAFVLRRISPGVARRYFVTGEIFDGRRAAELGLVSEAVPAEALERRTAEIVSQILSVGPRAARESKRLVGVVAGASFPEILEETARWIAELRGSEEAREGMAAFLEKRPPAWREGSS